MSEGLKYEIDRIRVLLDHDNRPASVAAPILRAERNTRSEQAEAREVDREAHSENATVGAGIVKADTNRR